MSEFKKPDENEKIYEFEVPDDFFESLASKDKPEPTTHVSLLLGAGFSAPNGYPTSSTLNNRLKKIDASEILIAPSGTAFFLNGQPDINAILSTEKRFFVQRFLEFYQHKINKEKKSFHYEDFFDYYTDLLQGKTEDEDYSGFAKIFLTDYGYPSDERQLLHEFDKTYQQLIAGRLYKRIEHVHTSGYPGYQGYLKLLSKLGEDNFVHIHTLNHDLLMEQLEHTDELAFKFSDGFTELGSPYYFRKDGMTVRTRMFNNIFDKRFRLYKLHGSVDNLNYKFNHEIEIVKHIHGANYTDLMREYTGENGKLNYHQFPWNWHPNYLSGTTAKTRYYSESYYYKQMFEHFNKNLQNSSLLIIIGYGFNDLEINRMIQEEFLSRNEVVVMVIKRNKIDNPITRDSKVRFIPNDVSNIDADDILRNISKQFE